MNNNRGTSRRRGRGNNRPQPSGRSGGMDQGNRIDSRARGNATQMLEKYKKMAHDAQMNGDRVATEYYLQFADHYFRVLADNRARQDEYRRPREEQNRDNGSDYADDDDDIGFNSISSPRNYSQDQSDDDGDDQDDNRGNRGNGNQRNESRQSEGRQNDGRQNEGRQNEGRRERRPREENQDRQGQERQNQDRQGQDRQNQERQGRPRSDRQDQAPRAAAPAPAPSPAPAATPAAEADDQSAAPRRILRGRGRPPRAAETEGSNGLDPMILPPAIGVPAEDKTEAEAPKPKRRAAPRRKAAESGDVEAAAAE